MFSSKKMRDPPVYNRNDDVDEGLDYLVNSTLQDLILSLSYPWIDNDVGAENENECELIKIDDFNNWMDGINFNEYDSNSIDSTHWNNNLSPTLYDSIEHEPIDTDEFADWLEDIDYNKNTEIEDFLNYNGSSIVTSMGSPGSSCMLLDDNIKKEMVQPLNSQSKSQIKDKTIQSDTEEKNLNNLEMSFSLLSKNISQNLLSIMPQKNNHIVLRKRKSIEMKIQDSQKRLEVLRVQNTLLMNRELLAGGSPELDTLRRFIRTTSLR